MKVFSVSLIASMLVFSAAVWAQEEFPKPGPEHEALKQMVGEWDAKMTCHVPGSPQQESTGIYKAKLDVGGFFLVTEFNGKFLGNDFQGRGLSGYDPFKKKYAGVWVDSMSPGIYTVEGEFDKAGKVFNEKMEGPGPDGKPMKMRTVTELKSKDSMHWKMFANGDDGKEMLMMEIAYTRKK